MSRCYHHPLTAFSSSGEHTTLLIDFVAVYPDGKLTDIGLSRFLKMSEQHGTQVVTYRATASAPSNGDTPGKSTVQHAQGRLPPPLIHQSALFSHPAVTPHGSITPVTLLLDRNATQHIYSCPFSPLQLASAQMIMPQKLRQPEPSQWRR